MSAPISQSHMLVDRDAVAAARNAWAGKAIADIENKHGELENDYKRALLVGVGDDGSVAFEKMGLATADTPEALGAANAKAFMALNSEFAGVADALSQANAMLTARQEIEQGGEGAGLPRGQSLEALALEAAERAYEMRDVRRSEDVRQTPYEALAQVAGAQGGDLGERLKAAGPAGLTLEGRLGEYRTGPTAAFDTAAYPEYIVREPGTELMPRRQARIVTLMPTMPVDKDAFKWMLETVNTNKAKVKAEGSEYEESVFGATEQTGHVQDIGTIVPVSERVMDDEMEAQDYLNNVLPEAVELSLDNLAITGAGGQNDITGMETTLPAGNKIVAADNASGVAWLKASRAAYTRVRKNGRCFPTSYVIDPEILNLMVTDTSTAGGFYGGSPFSGWELRLWGHPLLEHDGVKNAAAGDVPLFIADFTRARRRIRRGTKIVMGLMERQLAKREWTLRADCREQIVWKRPLAIGGVARKA